MSQSSKKTKDKKKKMSVESHDSLTNVRESRKKSIVINSANDSNFFIWKLIL